MRRDRYQTLYISLAYFAFGVVWIVGSDTMLGLVIADVEKHAMAQTVKGIVFIVVSSLFVGLILNDERRRRSSLRRELVKRAKDMRNLQRRLVDIRENERRELAADLHNDLGQSLSALRLNLQGAWGARNRQARRQMIELVDRMIDLVRMLSQDLRITRLDQQGLEAALRDYLGRVSDSTSVALDIRCEPLPKDIARLPAIAAYRIAQEAVSNAIRHGHPASVTVRLQVEGSDLKVEIVDDGRGFDPEAVLLRGKGSGVGLNSMREYAAMADGKLDLESRPGGGCRVIATLPVHAAAQGES